MKARLAKASSLDDHCGDVLCVKPMPGHCLGGRIAAAAYSASLGMPVYLCFLV